LFIPEPDPDFIPIPDPGSKRHWIPDPDPQHCFGNNPWGLMKNRYINATIKVPNVEINERTIRPLFYFILQIIKSLIKILVSCGKE
jgi:hypothetical protein